MLGLFWLTWLRSNHQTMTDNDSQPTECDNCGYQWDYGGKYNSQTTCPDCQRKTSIGFSADQEQEIEV